jgi:hypothetical protein
LSSGSVFFAKGSSGDDVRSSRWNFGRFFVFEGRVRAGLLRSSQLRMLKSSSPWSLSSKKVGLERNFAQRRWVMDALDSCDALLSGFVRSVDGEALGIGAYDGLDTCRFIIVVVVIVVVVGINGPGRIVAHRRRKLDALNVWFAPWDGSGGGGCLQAFGARSWRG